MSDGIKRLNPSVNYDDTQTGGLNNNELLIKTHLREKKYSKYKNYKDNDDIFYKLFSLMMAFVFMIIILNITLVSYKSLNQDVFNPCKNVLSEDIIDIYTSIDNENIAMSALTRLQPMEYSFIEYKAENCGRHGSLAYYFRGNDTTYVVCDDETIMHTERVCIEQGHIVKLLRTLSES